jgi:hypothetical protein
MSGRRSGKSRMNEMVREKFAEMGMTPCPHCGVPGKWDIFHPLDKPCPKQQQDQP